MSLSRLSTLLQQLFSPSELRRMLAGLNLPGILHALPGETAPLAEQAFAAASLLERLGGTNQEFFSLLIRERPQRYQEIVHISRLYGLLLDLPEPPATYDAPPLVFLSYALKDRSIVEDLARAIHLSGAQPWFDVWELASEFSAQPALAAAIDAADFIVICVGDEDANPWQEPTVGREIRKRWTDPTRDISVLSLPSRDGRDLPQHLAGRDAVVFSSDFADGVRRLMARIRGEEIAHSRRMPDGRCPYRGLEVFREEHARWMFGRREEVARLVEFLKASRLLTLVGASGSGKSSLVRSGLIPAIRAGELDGSYDWRVACFRPGVDPLTNLALSVQTLGGIDAAERSRLKTDPEAVERYRRAFFRSSRGLEHTIALILHGLPASTRILLVVDQFEEIFSADDGASSSPVGHKADSEVFLDNLLSCLAAVPQLHAVIIVRADFIPRCLGIPALATQMDSTVRFALPPMQKAQLEQAIRMPARSMGVEVELAVVEALAEEVAWQPASLPLLQHVLKELWELRDPADCWIRYASMQRLGGLSGAIAKSAERVVASLDEAGRESLRRLIPRLVHLGDGNMDTRRRAKRSEWAEDPVRTKVVNALLAARLLTIDQSQPGREETVELVHEVLLREWDDVVSWIQENRFQLLMLQELRRAAEGWNTENQPSDELWRGSRLVRALALLDDAAVALTTLERDFLRHSKEAEQAALEEMRQLEADLSEKASLVESERRQRVNEAARAQRQVILILTATVALLGMLLALAVWQYMLAEVSKTQLADLDERNREDASVEQLGAEALLLAQQAGKEQDALRTAIKAASRGMQKGRLVPPRVMQGLAAAVATPVQRPVVLRHSDEIVAADFSHDGTRVLTASRDHSAHLWDAVSGRSIRMLAEHNGAVLAAMFSLGDARVFTVGADRTARLWNAASGDLLETYKGLVAPQPGRFLAAMAPDASRAALSQSDRTLRLADLRSGKTIETLRGHTGEISAAAFSPDGMKLVTACADGTARLWSAESGRMVAVMEGHASTLRSIGFSPNGARIITVDEGRSGRLWSDQGLHLAALTAHTGTILGAVFSGDSSTLATHSDDHSAILWSAHSGKPIAVLPGHTGAVLDLAFSDDGRRLVTASADNTAKVWSAASAGGLVNSAPEVDLTGHTDPVRMARFSPDGLRVLTASDDTTARLWTSSGNVVAVLEGHSDKVRIGRFSPDGARVITVGDDNTARLWDASLSNAIPTLKGHAAPVRLARFSPDGTRIVTVSDDKTARLWDQSTHGLVRELEGHSGPVVSAVFAGDGSGRLLTVAEDDRTVRLWDGHSGDLLAAVSHAGPVLAGTFRHDGARIITAGDDDTLRSWNLESGKEVQAELCQGMRGGVDMAVLAPGGEFALTATRDSNRATLTALIGCVVIADLVGHSGPISSAAFSPDGALVATISTDNTTKLWSTRYGNDLDTLDSGSGAVHSVVFSHDGLRLVVATARDAWVYELTEEGTRTEVLATLQGHSAAVLYAGFSANAARIVTASSDNTAKLWAVSNPGYELVATLNGHSAAVNFAEFSPDGARVVTASSDSRVKVFPTTLEAFFRRACDVLRSLPDEFEEVEAACGP